MIAVSEPTTGACVLLYKTLRGYASPSVEPVDFYAMVPGKGDLDDALAKLGYVRTEDWAPVPQSEFQGSWYAKVLPI